MVRQIRSKREEDSDDEPAIKPKPAVKKPILTTAFRDFDDDDTTENCTTSSQIKSDKKSFKKIRQAPDAAAAMAAPEQLSEPITSYSADHLNQLRESQNFAKFTGASNHVLEEMEGMELVGDEAELLDQRLEQEQEQQHGMVSGAWMGTQPDDNALLAAAKKLASRHGYLRPDSEFGDEPDRVQLVRPVEKIDFDGSGVSNKWEEEMMRRAGVDTSSTSSTLAGSHVSSRTNPSSAAHLVNSLSMGVTIPSIQAHLNRTIIALAETTSAATRHLANLTLRHSTAAESMKSLTAEIAPKVAVANIASMLRVFMAEVVGMLRSKESMVHALQKGYTDLVCDLRLWQAEARRAWVEDAVLLVHHTGGMVNLGTYIPSRSLAEAQKIIDSTSHGAIGGDQDFVDEFGRSCDPAQRRAAMMDRLVHAASSRLEAIRTTDLALPPNILFASSMAGLGVDDDDSSSPGVGNPATPATTVNAINIASSPEPVGFAIDCAMSTEHNISLDSRIERLQLAGRMVFEDVEHDVSSIPTILARLAEFRRASREKYDSAYIALSLPPVLVPLVQWDLIMNPIIGHCWSRAEGEALGQREWFVAIDNYSREGMESAAAHNNSSVATSAVADDDASLLSRIITLAVIPLLVKTVQGLDPLNTKQMMRCVEVLQVCEELNGHFLPAQSGPKRGQTGFPTQQLWAGILAQVESSLLSDTGDLALAPILRVDSELGNGDERSERKVDGRKVLCDQMHRYCIVLANICLLKRLRLDADPHPVPGPGIGQGNTGHDAIARLALRILIKALPCATRLLSAEAARSSSSNLSSSATHTVATLCRVALKLLPPAIAMSHDPKLASFLEALRALVVGGTAVDSGAVLGAVRRVLGAYQN